MFGFVDVIRIVALVRVGFRFACLWQVTHFSVLVALHIQRVAFFRKVFSFRCASDTFVAPMYLCFLVVFSV